MNLKRMITVVPCAVVALACSSSLEGEDVATVTEPLSPAFVGSLGFPGTESAIASRGTNLFDLFALQGSGTVNYHRYSSGWHTPIPLGKPSGVNLTSVAAVNNGGRLDLFASGSNGKIYHRFTNQPQPQSNPTWQGGWSEVPGATTFTAGNQDRLAVTSWEPGRLDLFWFTPSFKIGHKWAIGNAWQGTESGDTPALKWFQPLITEANINLEAVSTRPQRIDIVLQGKTWEFQHHWYDAGAGGWGTAQNPHRDRVSCWNNHENQACTVGDLAIMSAGPNDIEVFIKDVAQPVGDRVLRAQYSQTSGWVDFGTLADASTDFVGVTMGAGEVLSDGIRTTGSRRDLFGATGGTVWQAYFP